MPELFKFNELKSGKVFASPKKEGKYEFQDLEETKHKRGNKGVFSLVYGQEQRIEGKKLLEMAKNESKEILKRTKKKVAEIEKDAYGKGEKKAFEDGKNKLEPVFEMFQEKIKELLEYQKEVYLKAEEGILALSLSLASRIIHHEVRAQKDLIIGAIKSATKKILSREQVTIRLNPEDMEYVLQNKPELKDDLKDIQQVAFKEDAAVGRGGCIIDTDFGSIDATVEKEFYELSKQLKKELEVSRMKKKNGDEV